MQIVKQEEILYILRHMRILDFAVAPQSSWASPAQGASGEHFSRNFFSMAWTVLIKNLRADCVDRAFGKASHRVAMDADTCSPAS